MKKIVLKKMFLLMLTATSFLFFSCKDDLLREREEPISPPTQKVELHYSQQGVEAKGTITSGQTITGDVDYYFSFFLSPAPYVKGLFEITSMDGSVTYYSSPVAKNAIDWKAPSIGQYLMEVSGTYNDSTFLFNNIRINVTDNCVPPVSNTYPVRLLNPRIVNSNVLIDVEVNKGVYNVSPYSSYSWFYVKRTNGLNFIGGLTATATPNDSIVRFTLEFPAIDNNYIEFMAGMYNSSQNGLWLTPSSYSGCLLYSGSENLPYNESGYYFGFRLVANGSNYELKSYSGTTLLSFSGQVGDIIPGEAGDLSSNNYQVRWTGFTHYIKTNLSNPVLRYKIGNGNWVYQQLTQFSQNENYWYLTFPNISGELFFQWGIGSNNNDFVLSNEIQNSMYYITNLNMLAKNI